MLYTHTFCVETAAKNGVKHTRALIGVKFQFASNDLNAR